MCLLDNGSGTRKRVLSLLKQTHTLQKDLASALGMYPQTLSNKLRGKRPFTLRDISRIADFFDVSVDFLLGRSGYAKPLEVA